MQTLSMVFTKWEYWAQFHGSAYRRILRLRSRLPSNTEYARAEAKIRRLPVKYACRKHIIPCFRKRRFCAYGKQSHDIGLWSLTEYQTCPVPLTIPERRRIEITTEYEFVSGLHYGFLMLQFAPHSEFLMLFLFTLSFPASRQGASWVPLS